MASRRSARASGRTLLAIASEVELVANRALYLVERERVDLTAVHPRDSFGDCCVAVRDCCVPTQQTVDRLSKSDELSGGKLGRLGHKLLDLIADGGGHGLNIAPASPV